MIEKKYWLHGGGYFECDISLNRGSSSISPQQTTTHTTTPTKCTRLNQNSTRYQNLKSLQKLPHNHDRFRSLKWTEKDNNGLRMVLNGIITMNYVTLHFDCCQTEVLKRRNSTYERFSQNFCYFRSKSDNLSLKMTDFLSKLIFCRFFDKFINS